MRTVVMPGHHIDLDDGRPLALPTDAVRAGQVVQVLRHGDELAVWTTDSDPRLLALHRPDGAPVGYRRPA